MANSKFAKVRKELKGSGYLDDLETSDIYSALMILGDWTIIAMAIAVSYYTENIAIYLLSIPVIGARMMALGVLMHEASHGNLFKKAALNGPLTNLLLAWPLGRNVTDYKNVHRQHHQYLKQESDTEKPLEAYHEFQFPLSKKKWYTILLSDIIGINYLKYRLSKVFSRSEIGSAESDKSRFTINRPQVYTTLIAIAVLIISGFWQEFLLFWLIPYCTWFQVLLRLHASSEHFAIPTKTGFQTRTLKINPIEAFFFFPHHMNYHCEHHLYPQVPFRYLPELHMRLLEEVNYQSNTHLTHGIKGLFTELTNV
ncbi:MAG: fatty acid desaturase family protein [Roseivirga sp.]|nr:fatty acid desaturase family protein [Roseivirga sp.]